MTIALIIISILTAIFGGFCKAICDLSEEGKLKFKKKSFWLKELSWVNKYKNGLKSKGEKFWGSSRWFVMFTDAWHLFGFLERVSLVISFTMVGHLVSINAYFLFGVLVNYIVFTGVFHIFHTYKILRK